MILETLVTTVDPNGAPHLAPMGPRMSPDFRRFILRPFPTSQTYLNLVRHGEGVMHITDDSLLLARAAIGAVEKMPPLREAEFVRGFILADCCRYHEFVVKSIDTGGERVHIEAEVVHSARVRDCVGFNRARHAIVEAAILATRLHILPLAEVAAEFAKLRVIVEKTGGEDELAAMKLLEAKLHEAEGR